MRSKIPESKHLDPEQGWSTDLDVLLCIIFKMFLMQQMTYILCDPLG